MKANLTALTAAVLIAGLGATVPASSTDLTPLPPLRTQGAVSYLTGGVGADEASAIKQAAATYSLELLFAQKASPHDAFVADVKVTIRDRSGNAVLKTATEGPYLLAKLPAGTYKIEAEYGGKLKTRSVEIHRGKHRREVFVWPTHGEDVQEVSEAARPGSVDITGG